MPLHRRSGILLWLNLLIVIVQCDQTPPPPAEVFCVDRDCDKSIAQVRMVKDFSADGKLLVSRDTVVDMVAKSALTEDSRVKILHNGRTHYVDATFVQEIQNLEPNNFKRFSNRDAKSFDGNQTPRTLSHVETNSVPVESEEVMQKTNTFMEKGTSESITNTAQEPKIISLNDSSENNVSTEKITSSNASQTDPIKVNHLTSIADGKAGKIISEELVQKTDFTIENVSAMPEQPSQASVTTPGASVSTPSADPNMGSHHLISNVVNASESEVASNVANDETKEPPASFTYTAEYAHEKNAIVDSGSVGEDIGVHNSVRQEEKSPDTSLLKEESNTTLEMSDNSAFSEPNSPLQLPSSTEAMSDTGALQNSSDTEFNKSEPARGDISSKVELDDIDSPQKIDNLPTIEPDSLSPSHSVDKPDTSPDDQPPSERSTKETSSMENDHISSRQSNIEQKSSQGESPESGELKTEQSQMPPMQSISVESDRVTSLQEQTISEEDKNVPEKITIDSYLPNSHEDARKSQENLHHSGESVSSANVHSKRSSDRDESIVGESAGAHTHIPSTEPSVLQQPQETDFAKDIRDSKADPNLPIVVVSNDNYPRFPSLLQCIVWAANGTRDRSGVHKSGAPLARLMIKLHDLAELLVSYLPSPMRFITEKFTNMIDLPLDFVAMWLIVAVSLFVAKSIASVLFGLARPRDTTKLEYFKAKEQVLQLSSRLSDQEEANTQLTKLTAQLTDKLQNIQSEHSGKVVSLQKLVDSSKTDLFAVEKQLAETLEKCNILEQEFQSRLAEKEQNLLTLDSELCQLNEERLAVEEQWKTKLTELNESHQKAMEDAKREHEDLYHQAVDYYNRMKAMQPEMDKLIEARKQAEDKVAALQTELDSLRTTFTTLKSFELALEQETQLINKKSKNCVEQSDYMLIERSGESDVDSNKNDHDTVDEMGTKRSRSGSTESGGSGNNEVSEESEHHESKLRANLSLFLDVGRLQAELTAAQSRIKGEEARAECEHELRIKLEEKVEQIERENSTLRTQCSQAEEEKSAAQTRLDILSAYFKERELELQRDLGKHVVVGSESSDAINSLRKRNKELEAELKSLREQVNSMRRELSETERINRRQISELDKRSHENWLAARAADHQVKELRDENTLLRQKLLDAERAILPPALRTQQMNQARLSFPAGQLPPGVAPRPTLRSSFTPSSGRLEKRSLSGQSLTSLSSQTSMSRPEVSNLPFPVPPPPPPPPIIMPRNMSPGGMQSSVPPFIPGLSPSRLPFPHGFPPPPPPPPPPLLPLPGNLQPQLSPSSSAVDSSVSRAPS
ncbi:unnamed protein product [Echinostoma caproni]|uniref:Transport and Golgi organization protein 1 n=1 Tax=Echinostoma caproni TaxID=27848 RepID=A0A183ACH3_9TREM|nr:unnamed protein product [Echinostoma caproni]